MNLDTAPTKEQLRDLLAECDDRTAHHVLWVSRAGEVQIARVAPDRPLVGFDQAHPDLRLRYETFERGNEYVGPEAAADDGWVSQLLDSLRREWAGAKNEAGVEYVRLW